MKPKDKVCCKRFGDAVQEGLISRSESNDETDWYFPEGGHLYYCPFCGTHIKGAGYGNYDTQND